MKQTLVSVVATLAVGLACMAQADNGPMEKQALRGRYLLHIGGCNDCHTPEYAESGGKIPEPDRYVGSSIGFQGPWGITYPANLRLLVQGMSESQFLVLARKPMRPPMPWFNLRDMTDGDVKAIYTYLRYLGPKGKPAPAYAAPGQTVSTPYYVFVPTSQPQQAMSGK